MTRTELFSSPIPTALFPMLDVFRTLRELGLVYHIDDDPADIRAIVDAPGEPPTLGARTFTDSEADWLRRFMQAADEACRYYSDGRWELARISCYYRDIEARVIRFRNTGQIIKDFQPAAKAIATDLKARRLLPGSTPLKLDSGNHTGAPASGPAATSAFSPAVPSHAINPVPPRCATCGKPATCFGAYEGGAESYACDGCCGHGNEDGHCNPIGAPDSGAPASGPALDHNDPVANASVEATAEALATR